MIDPARITYRLEAHLPNGAVLPLPTSGLQWEELAGELAVRVQARLPNLKTSHGYVHELLALGTRLMLLADWGQGPREVWRGRVWTWRYTDSGAATVEVTAYNDLIYLQQSEDDRVYPPGISATNVIQDILREWGIGTIGTVQLANVPLPQLVWRGAKVSQMLLDVLEHIFDRGGGAWILRSRLGMLEIVQPGQNTPVYSFGTDHVEEFSDEQDMHDLVTEVRILASANDLGLGDDVPVRPEIIEVKTGRQEFGLLRAIVRDPGPDSPVTAQQLAYRLLGERGVPRRVRRLTAPDLPFLRRGDLIHVRAGTIDGRYAITGIQHDAERRKMQITIDTSGTLTYRQALVDPTIAPLIGHEPDDRMDSVIDAQERQPVTSTEFWQREWLKNNEWGT